MRVTHDDGARLAGEVLGVVGRSVVHHQNEINPRDGTRGADCRRYPSSLIMSNDQHCGGGLRCGLSGSPGGGDAT